MTTDYLTQNPPTARERDPLYVFGTQGLEPAVVEMMTRFGGATRETALIERIFFFDPQFDLVWETQFMPELDSRPAIVANTLKWGLLAMFAPRTEWAKDEDFDTAAHALWRWQQVTPTLLALGDVVQPDYPWLYGWAKLGAELYAENGPPRLDLWNTRLARAAARCPIDAQIGRVWVDELPRSIDELRALKGVGDATITRVESELIDMLLPREDEPSLMNCQSGGPFHSTIPFVSADRPGRNDPCPCGSGRKYKRCCLRQSDP